MKPSYPVKRAWLNFPEGVMFTLNLNDEYLRIWKEKYFKFELLKVAKSVYMEKASKMEELSANILVKSGKYAYEYKGY